MEFDRIILEHILFTNDTEKAKILKKKTTLNNIFWISFLGPIALRKNFKDNIKIKQYFTTMQKLRLQNITDNSNDMLYAIKMLVDRGSMSEANANKLTLLLAKLKTGVDINEGLLFDQIKMFMMGKIVTSILPSAPIVTLIRDVKKGQKTLNDLIIPCYNFAKKIGICKEFVNLAKPIINNITTTAITQVITTNTANVSMAKNTIGAISGGNKTIQKNKIKLKLNTIEEASLGAIKLANNKQLTSYYAFMHFMNEILHNSTNILKDIDSTNHTNYKDLIKNIDISDFSGVLSEIIKIPSYKAMLEINTIDNPLYTALSKYDTFVGTGLYNSIIEHYAKNLNQIFTPDYYFKIFEVSKDIPNVNEIYIYKILMSIIKNNDPINAKLFFEYYTSDSVIWKKYTKMPIKINKLLSEQYSIFSNIFDTSIFDDITIKKSFSDYISVNFSILTTKLYNKLVYLKLINTATQYDTIINTAIHEYLIYNNLRKLSTTYNMITNNSKTYIEVFEELLPRIMKTVGNNIKIFNNIFNDIFVNYKDNTIVLLLPYFNIKNIDSLPDIMQSRILRSQQIFEYFLNKPYDSDVVDFYNYLIEKYNRVSNLNTFKILISYLNTSTNQKLVTSILLFRINLTFKYSKSKLYRDIPLMDLPYNILYEISFSNILKYIINYIDNAETWEYNALYAIIFKIINEYKLVNIDKIVKTIETNMSDRYYEVFLNSMVSDTIDKESDNKHVHNNTYNFINIYCIDFIFKIAGITQYRFFQLFNYYMLKTTKIKKLNEIMSSIENYINDMSNSLQDIDKYIQDNIKIVYGYDSIETFSNVDIDTKTFITIPAIQHRLINFFDIKLLDSTTQTNIINTAPRYIDNNKFLKQFIMIYPNSIEKIQHIANIINIRNLNKPRSGTSIDLKNIISENSDIFSILTKDNIDVLDNIDANVARSIFNKITAIDESTIAKFIIDPNRNNGIVPNIEISKIPNLLKFNNFKLTKSTNKKAKETYKEAYIRIKKDENALFSSISNIKVTPIVKTDIELNKKSVKYFDKYHAGKHGDVAMKILEEFNVSLSDDEWSDFRQIFPSISNQIMPGFHGTGTVAASMILRFGFKIANKQDLNTVGVSTAGRMLGDGIYFGTTLDKVAGYVGDRNWSQTYGTIGYVFEMDATLGKKSINYEAMGLGGDNIKSPEYVVFNPRAQLKILKAYRVELTSIKQLNRLRKLNESLENKFDNTLNTIINEKIKKTVIRKKYKNVIKWVFYDGDVIIPNKNNTIKFIDDVKFMSKYVSYAPSSMGITIEFENTLGLNNTIFIPNVFEFIKKDPHGLFTQYKTLMSGKLQ